MSKTITVFHGSKTLFDEFSLDFMGTNGTDEGKGIYFTDNIKIANGYGKDGYVYTAALDTTKALQTGKRTLKRSEVVKLFKHLYSLDEYHLSNYGEVAFEGFNKVLNEAVTLSYDDEECDAEILGGIANAIGSAAIVNQAVVDALGYTCLVCNDVEWGNQTIYIALVPAAVDIIEVVKQ